MFYTSRGYERFKKASKDVKFDGTKFLNYKKKH